MRHPVRATTPLNASAARLGEARKVAGSKRVRSAATGQARRTCKINNGRVPFQKREDSQRGGCYKNIHICYKLLCFKTQDATVLLDRK